MILLDMTPSRTRSRCHYWRNIRRFNNETHIGCRVSDRFDDNYSCGTGNVIKDHVRYRLFMEIVLEFTPEISYVPPHLHSTLQSPRFTTHIHYTSRAQLRARLLTFTNAELLERPTSAT